MKKVILLTFLMMPLTLFSQDKGKYELKDKSVYDMEQFADCKNKEGDDLNKCIQDGFSKLNDAQKEELQMWNDNVYQSSVQEKQNVKLQKFLQEKMERNMYGSLFNEGSTKGKKARLADHNVFYDLYKSQLTKSITLLFSSYCIEADLKSVDKGFDKDGNEVEIYYTFIPKEKQERDKNRKKNITILNNYTVAGSAYNGCLSNIPKICDGHKHNKSPATDDDIKYSKERACHVTHNLRKLRQRLVKIAEIQGLLKDKMQKGGGIQNDNHAVYIGAKMGDAESVDDMTTITSKEFSEKSGFNEGVDAEIKKFEECESNNFNGPGCAKFTKEGQDAIASEYEADAYATSLATAERLEDKKELEQFLRDSGRIEEADLLKSAKMDDITIQKIREQVTEDYENEKKQLIESMKNKLSQNVDTSKDLASQQGTIDKIKNELEGQKEDYKELMYFNNIITGYLTIESVDGDGRSPSANGKTFNTGTIIKELGNSAYDPSQNPDIKNSNFADLQEQLNQIKENHNVNTGSSVNIEVNQINEKILQVEKYKKKP